MTLTAKAYIGFIVALGTLAGVHAYHLWNPHDLWRFFCYLILAVPASGLKVRLPGVQGTMSVLFVFLLASIVELGLPETLVISAVCVAVQSYWRPKTKPRVVQVVFSIAVLFCAASVADLAYRFEGPQWLVNAPPFRLAVLASVFFFANTFPVAAVIALTENKKLGKVWVDLYSWTFPYYLVGAALVGMFGFASRALTWQAWILILPAVYAIYRSYHLYLDRLENQRARAEEERRHADQVAELLTQTMASNDALRRANEDLEQFAYAASHDLQEPLRMIAIYSQLLQRRHSENLGEDSKELLDTVIDSANRINQLVLDLLSYTRVENPDNTDAIPTNPSEVLQEVQQALMDRIDEVGAIITSDQIAPLTVHRTHLFQLFQNLLSNSLKYHSDDRNPKIHITSVPASNGMVELRVEDNGIGIDSAYHERIFGVFKRLHSRRVPGTGIGLAICKRIVQYYGGTIWVKSNPSVGSTFHFTLPASASSDNVKEELGEDRRTKVCELDKNLGEDDFIRKKFDRWAACRASAQQALSASSVGVEKRAISELVT